MIKRKTIVTKIRKINASVLAAISGLLFILALPPFNLSFLAFIGLLPLIYSFGKDNFYFGFSKGFFFGLILNIGILYWLAGNQGTTWYFATLSMLGAVLVLAVQYGVLGLIISFIGKSLGKKTFWVSLPFLFAAFEFLTSHGILGFTWNSLCYTQTDNLLPAQIASLFSCYGLTFWIILINILIYWTLIDFFRYHIPYKKLVISLIIFSLPYCYGFSVLRDGQEKPETMISAGLVQPNVDPNEKWIRSNIRKNLDTLYALSDSVISDLKPNKTDLIVWPETAVPAYIKYRTWVRHELYDFVSKRRVSLITAAPDFVEVDSAEYELYNATFVINPDNLDIESYNKIRLVPFGEKIPLSNIFESLKKINLGQGNFNAGDSVKLFEVPLKSSNNKKEAKSILCSSAICYESGFSDLVRKGVKKGSRLLVIVTNDAWFGNTSAPYLHAAIAKLRAIENQIPIVRAANTGISMIINKNGQTLKKCAFNEKCYLAANLEVRSGLTLYDKIGESFNWIIVLVSTFLFGLSIFKFRQNSNKKGLL